MNFTEQQLRDFKAYERVRQGGRFNMLDPNARRASSLDEEPYFFVMGNYTELKAAVEAADAAKAAP